MKNSPRLHHLKYRLGGLLQSTFSLHGRAYNRRFVEGFSDHRTDSPLPPEDARILERISQAYRKAVTDQQGYSAEETAGQMWGSFLDTQFQSLRRALSVADIPQLTRLLSNLHREQFSLNLHAGAGAYRSYISRECLYNYEYVRTWRRYYRHYVRRGGQPHDLTYPLVGNPVGLVHHAMVVPLDAIRYHSYALDIVQLACNGGRALVCEIGGGTGGQAYAALTRAANVTYLLLDIPEVLAISSYFLLKAFPHVDAKLYGEGAPFQFADTGSYRLLCMPMSVLPKIPDRSVDLFFNACSLTEMDARIAEAYLAEISRAGRRYFMHENHDARMTWVTNGITIKNLTASEIIPDRAYWKLMSRSPRRFNTPSCDLFCRQNSCGFHVHLYARHDALRKDASVDG